MGHIYGYIRTSRRAGSDPESQHLQLLNAGVDPESIYRDVGVSGSTGTNTRAGWRLLDSRLAEGDVLVMASVDRIGRNWLDTVDTLRGLFCKTLLASVTLNRDIRPGSHPEAHGFLTQFVPYQFWRHPGQQLRRKEPTPKS